MVVSKVLNIILMLVCLAPIIHGLNRVCLSVEIKNKKTEYRIVDYLVVNDRNRYKTIIYKGEKKGISEMRRLLARSRIEESWIYLPDQEKWIEVGYNEEPEKEIHKRYVTKAKLDVRLLDIIMQENNCVVLYHFHSSNSLSLNDIVRKRAGYGVPMTETEIEKERIKLLIKSAYPSRSDMLNMVGNSAEFFQRNYHGEITFKICSHYGITEYQLTDKGVEQLHTDNALNQILRITDRTSLANIVANIKGDILEMNPKETTDPLDRIKMSPKQKRESLSRYIIDPISRIEKAISLMNGEYVKVTFTPYQ